jgi:predicted ribosomally synthesized peptide with SipW-like signal peptide
MMLIGVVVMLAGAGLYAYFSDTESSTGNIFTAGTLDLKIRNGDESWGDGVTSTWTMSNMKPGDTCTGFLGLKRLGTISADHLEITCSSSVTDPLGPESDTEEGTTDMDKAMEITHMLYYDDTWSMDLLALLTDHNGNGIKDLDDFETQGFDGLTPPNGATWFEMDLRFHPTLADNDYQGDILTTTITFTLNQHSSQ